MSDYITKMGGNFDPVLAKKLFDRTGEAHSTLLKFTPMSPIPFTGIEQWTIDSEDGVQIVNESTQKDANEIKYGKIQIIPHKFVFQHRYSQELVFADQETQLGILNDFTNRANKEFQKGYDLVFLHGLVPFTGRKASFYGTESLDGKVGITKAYNPETLDDDINDVINEMDEDPTGIAFSRTARKAMGNLKNELGGYKYPEFRNVGNPSVYGNMDCDVNKLVESAPSDAETPYKDHVIIGDFANSIVFGYSKTMPFEVISYGDPDGKGRDLKAYNEVCLRVEAYIGAGILDPSKFAIIGTEGE